MTNFWEDLAYDIDEDQIEMAEKRDYAGLGQASGRGFWDAALAGAETLAEKGSSEEKLRQSATSIKFW